MPATKHGFPVNYDEAAVPAYILPDVLLNSDASRVQNSQDWLTKRKPEILRLFEEHLYGQTPHYNGPIKFEVRSVDENVLEGKAIRKQIRIYFEKPDQLPKIDVLVYLPKGKVPCPIFLGLNFQGNQIVEKDPAIKLADCWVNKRPEFNIPGNVATEESRGMGSKVWPVDEIISRGYGLATACYGDLDPDFDDGFQNGLHALFPKADPQPGAIAAWAWGLRRILDYLLTQPEIDRSRIIVMGHSRLGKAALWAGVQDERFAAVISNESGCGGAALFRRCLGETIEIINHNFPHWFTPKFKEYNNREADLPVDQHMLVSLVAPRPVYIASAAKDLWADPLGEMISAKHATPVYKLFGLEGFNGNEKLPPVSNPIKSVIGYHIRPGKHSLTPEDWKYFMDFTDIHLLARQK